MSRKFLLDSILVVGIHSARGKGKDDGLGMEVRAMRPPMDSARSQPGTASLSLLQVALLEPPSENKEKQGSEIIVSAPRPSLRF